MILLTCLILDRVKRQEKFSVWPLHLTLVPWFEIRGPNLSTFLIAIQRLANSSPKPTLTTMGSGKLGPKKVEVTIIKPTSLLINLHQDLLSIVLENNAKLISKNYVEENFKPHVTKRGERGPAQDRTVCRKLYLVAKCEDGERQVVEVVNFK